MFENNTVFITGAGASVHYGYPTGATLIDQIRRKAAVLQQFYEAMGRSGYRNAPDFFAGKYDNMHPRDAYRKSFEELNDFLARLNAVDPLVIDYFLGQNLHLEDLGKFLIAWAILEAESGERIVGGNYIRHITHVMSLGCQDSSDLLKNKVHFVTFNYDTSLERRVRAALGGLSVFQIKHIEEFFSEDRFRHVYGAVNDGISLKIDFSNFFANEASLNSTLQRTIEIINQVYSASRDLLVIDPANKNTAPDFRRDLRRTIETANTLIILGFGFDRFNTDLLNLADLISTSTTIKRIYMTNYNNISRVNQAIGKLFMNNKVPFDTLYAVTTNQIILRKSILSTDESLASDFDIE